ncbi:hypothetical protein [Phaeovulum sp. W22_SRMD_FR3]|uniref:hypothetical protein n=1 Tax=Phaeovulum sp. W22_SRMD_FR3 TaxID=3240274 RepID=UPI003F9902F7
MPARRPALPYGLKLPTRLALCLVLAACGAAPKPEAPSPVPAPYGFSGAGHAQPHLAERCVARLAADTATPAPEIRPGGITATARGNMVALSLRGTPYRCTADPGGVILSVLPEYPPAG